MEISHAQKTRQLKGFQAHKQKKGLISIYSIFSTGVRPCRKGDIVVLYNNITNTLIFYIAICGGRGSVSDMPENMEIMEKSLPKVKKASKPFGNTHFLYADFCACPLAGKWRKWKKGLCILNLLKHKVYGGMRYKEQGKKRAI